MTNRKEINLGTILSCGAIVVDLLNNEKDKETVLVFYNGKQYLCKLGEKEYKILNDKSRVTSFAFARKSTPTFRNIPESYINDFLSLKIGETIVHKASDQLGGNLVFKRISTQAQEKGGNLENDFVIVSGETHEY